ncbi:MAG TPA: hypothetical protein VFG50_14220 [Rhodothermales bacterium]|nr:hypothetical protein [Rhodothermales bacterium]
MSLKASVLVAALTFAVGVLLGLLLHRIPAKPGPPQAVDTTAVIPAQPTAPDLPRTLLDSTRLDLTGDGTPERLALYVDAARDSKGRLVWDDGQRWALVARTDSDAYVLFNRFVQLGAVRFWIVDLQQPGTPPIVVTLTETGAGVRATRYQFDPEQEGFRTDSIFDVAGNVLYNWSLDE